jgi:hypothetical protein
MGYDNIVAWMSSCERVFLYERMPMIWKHKDNIAMHTSHVEISWTSFPLYLLLNPHYAAHI